MLMQMKQVLFDDCTIVLLFKCFNFKRNFSIGNSHTKSRRNETYLHFFCLKYPIRDRQKIVRSVFFLLLIIDTNKKKEEND